jgi:hypothetical protein
MTNTHHRLIDKKMSVIVVIYKNNRKEQHLPHSYIQIVTMLAQRP